MASVPEGDLMLTGAHIYTVDPKGRVMLPRPFREGLGQPFIVTRAPGPHLVVFSRATWERVIQRLRDGHEPEDESTPLLRVYLGSASECVTDASTGRFLVPPALREYAGLRPGREAVVSGMGPLVEVWSKSRWDEALRLSSESLEEIRQLHEEMELPAPHMPARCDVRLRLLLGLQVLQALGQFDLQGALRLKTAFEDAEGRPAPALLVDLRRADSITPLIHQTLLTYCQRQQERGQLFAVVARADEEERLKGKLPGVKLLTSLEAALWWVESEVPAKTAVRRLRRA